MSNPNVKPVRVKSRWAPEQFAAREAAQKDGYARYNSKAVKAWAVVDTGEIWQRDDEGLHIYASQQSADDNCWSGQRVIPVHIVPVEGHDSK